jgi:hypothetical protein
LSDPSYNETTRQKFGASLEETLVECRYNEENCLDSFVWHFSYTYGNCFTFNLPQVKYVKKTGPLFGLNMECLTGGGVEKSPFTSLKSYGAILFVHNQTSKPETSSGILLKPGTHTDIVVKKSFTSLVPSPYSDCQDSSTFRFDKVYFNILQSENIKYNQQDCLDLCMQQEIVDRCNCYYLEFFKLNNQTKACLSVDEVNCAFASYEKFAEKDTVELCKNRCPLECDSLKYDFTISSAGGLF